MLAIGIYQYWYKPTHDASTAAASAAIQQAALDAADEAAAQQILGVLESMPNGKTDEAWILPEMPGIAQNNQPDYYKINGVLPKSGLLLATLDQTYWAPGEGGYAPSQAMTPSAHAQAATIWENYKASALKQQL